MGTFIKSDFVSTDTVAPVVEGAYERDRFLGDDGALTVAEGGSAWSKEGGTTYAFNRASRALAASASGTSASTTISNPNVNGILSVTIASTGTLNTGFVGLCMGRAALTTYGEYVFYWDGVKWDLKPRTGVDGYGASLGTSSVPWTSGMVVSLERNGSQLIARLNGVAVITITNTLYLGPLRGVVVRTANTVLKDFKWKPLP
jgi:hypothetical protein